MKCGLARAASVPCGHCLFAVPVVPLSSLSKLRARPRISIGSDELSFLLALDRPSLVGISTISTIVHVAAHWHDMPPLDFDMFYHAYMVDQVVFSFYTKLSCIVNNAGGTAEALVQLRVGSW